MFRNNISDIDADRDVLFQSLTCIVEPIDRKTVWHGTRLEALYSIMHHGRLRASSDCEKHGDGLLERKSRFIKVSTFTMTKQVPRAITIHHGGASREMEFSGETTF